MAALVDLVEYQLKNAKALSMLLSEETKAITARESSEIERFAKEKMAIIGQLQQTDQRLAQHQDVARLTDEALLAQKVADIKSIILDCQQLNDINGQSLQRAQLSFNKLNNLMQQSHGKVGMTYNAGGQTHTLSTLGTNLKA
ncbi:MULTISPECIES: flagella synthesis protein FlgN [Vibrio]|jgi:flagella synthesis protein FlgN|uniref:Flagella synthesis protein FlgN n=2 Tax=Vibrio TaxID=662 RepID=A0ABW7IGI0_9VIBR|nr:MULTISPECIES: flagellar export chaperone FlgN [Vibrio]KFA99405.1 molecular chaperone [Vibrio sp. ER1A]MCG9659682.1 flagellar export chaperone FlgN [Vibrio mediterranei]MCG9662339.1 flagellar export chaperone FlgN [Vibrio mediterranei]MCG9787784.1 flagellar export chaperone FlgN [Vibrio mediterranei]MCY9873934.1 flagellar export chaperone FlgN [Vibrio barjaei]